MIKSKLLLSTVFLLSSIFSFSQDTIPNGDFETWYSGTSPAYWQSTNSLLPPGVLNCFQISASYTGDYAVQIKTIDLDGTPIPGVLSLGEVGMGYTAGGIGFTGKPSALKGSFIHGSAGDEVMIIAQFFKNGLEMGTGFWSTTDSVANYTEFIAPVFFQTDENPDTLLITMITDQYTVGSSLVVDNLHMEYVTTSLPSEKATQLNIYPNPCTNHLFVDLPSNLSAEIRLFDMNGRLVLHKQAINGRLDTSSLDSGIYTLLVDTGDKIHREKIIIQ